MKEGRIAFFLFWGVGFLLTTSMVAAKQSVQSTYYTSSSGAYTKVQLANASGGPDQNTCFCAQSSTYPTGVNPNTNQCDTADSSVTYYNAGTIFTDPNSGNTEICKHDGSVASYAGSCFSRFCSGTGCAATCPTNYTAVSNTSSPFPGVTSYSCCLSTLNAQGQPTVAKAGCFSIYSNGNAAPASCASVDVNAYDMGCQSFNGTCSAVRTCCFNSGPNPLGFVSTAGCSGSGAIDGICTGWGACTPTSGSCGSGTQVCTASTNPSCGGHSAIGTAQGCTVACCTPNCDDGMCHAADYTGNCGQACAANCSGTNGCLGDSSCACGPVSVTFTEAGNGSNHSTQYCSSTCGVITSAVLFGSMCGSPHGTPGGTCTLIFNNLCTPVCDSCSESSYTGNCGQTCYANCSGGGCSDEYCESGWWNECVSGVCTYNTW
jgi:hypothetical protein